MDLNHSSNMHNMNLPQCQSCIGDILNIPTRGWMFLTIEGTIRPRSSFAGSEIRMGHALTYGRFSIHS